LIARKRRPLERTKTSFRDSKLIVIAAEGKKTEGQYFDMFRKKRCHVKVIPSVDGKTSPKYILDNLAAIVEEFDFHEDDQFWLMIDVDRWKKRELAIVAREAIRNGYSLSISNPCFECWLYLHFSDIEIKEYTSVEITNALRNILGGYNKSKVNVKLFEPHVTDALHRAQKLDVNKSDRWPQIVGSHVYKVVEVIMQSQ